MSNEREDVWHVWWTQDDAAPLLTPLRLCCERCGQRCGPFETEVLTIQMAPFYPKRDDDRPIGAQCTMRLCADCAAGLRGQMRSAWNRLAAWIHDDAAVDCCGSGDQP